MSDTLYLLLDQKHRSYPAPPHLSAGHCQSVHAAISKASESTPCHACGKCFLAVTNRDAMCLSVSWI